MDTVESRRRKFNLVQDIFEELIDTVQGQTYMSSPEFEEINILHIKFKDSEDINELYELFPKVIDVLKRFEF